MQRLPDGRGADTAREDYEGELFAPTGPYTVSNVYSLTSGATPSARSASPPGTMPLSRRPRSSTPRPALLAARVAYNDAHRLILDDGSSTNFTTAVSRRRPLPWFTADHTGRAWAPP